MSAIKNLEQLPGMLSTDKASILLVYGGLKPSAQVVVQGEPFGSSSDTTHISADLVATLDSILSELKLSYEATYETMNARSEGMLQEVMRVYIGPNKETTTQIKVAFDAIQENHLNAGLLLGYPRTAVEAFLTPEMLDWDDHPVSTAEVSEQNMRLLGHRLSKSNWRQEVEYLESYGTYLKEISPEIYQEITKKDNQ